MIIDKDLQIADAQAVTVSAASESHLDLGVKGDALGHELYFVALVDTAFTAAGEATLVVALECDEDSAFGSVKTLVATSAIPVASLVAGYKALVVKVPLGCERYVRGYFTVATGPMTANTRSGAKRRTGPTRA